MYKTLQICLVKKICSTNVVFILQDNTDNVCENTVATAQPEIIAVYPTEVAINEPCIVLWNLWAINNQRR